jgi:hypothetical protein
VGVSPTEEETRFAPSVTGWMSISKTLIPPPRGRNQNWKDCTFRGRLFVGTLLCLRSRENVSLFSGGQG